MKLAAKIFLCTLAVVVLALAASGYLIISSSFQNAVDRECERSLEEYQLLKFTLQSDILNATENSVVTGKVMQILAQHTAKIAPDGNLIAIFTREKGILYSDFPEDFLFDDLDEQAPERLMYGMKSFSGQYLLVISGRFTQNGQEIYLYTARDVSAIVEQRQQMQRQFLLSYLLILGISAVAVMIFSTVLTKPVLQLMRVTRRISNGRYDQRAAVSTRDEIGILCDSFNKMADTIEDKISELKLNAQQKEDFVSNFAHELKTPLTSISGFAELMKAGDVLENDVTDFSKSIYDEAQRLITLVNDIIKISELDGQSIPYEKETVDLYELSKEVIGRLEKEADKKNITFHLIGGRAEIIGVHKILEEMLYNLCDNAIKYNKENGTVDVLVNQTGDGVNVIVRDTGIGIPISHQDRVFERFYRVDKSHSKKVGGTGLGLAIVKHGALYHHAKLSLESTVDVGTVVTIAFSKK